MIHSVTFCIQPEYECTPSTQEKPHVLGYVTSIATVVSAIPLKPDLSGSWFSLAMLLMALLGVSFGTLSILAATVASFKAVGDGAEVRVLICTLTGETTLTLLRCTTFVRQELFMGSV